MKYIFVIILILVSCKNNEWTTDEQLRFNVDCVEAGQSKEHCQCLLRCLQAEYNNYTNNLVTFGLTTNDEMMIYYCHFTVGSPVNVNEKNLADLIVYPNPATNNFKITSEEKISQIQLYNALGKLAYNNNLNDFTHIVSLANNTPKGLYFVKVKSSSGIQTKKIIIQ